jgi:hypothetical protein
MAFRTANQVKLIWPGCAAQKGFGIYTDVN